MRSVDLLRATMLASIVLASGCASARGAADAGPGIASRAGYEDAVRDCRWRHADRRTHVRRASNYDPAIARCLRAAGWTPGGVPLEP